MPIKIRLHTLHVLQTNMSYLCTASACCSRLSTAACFDLRFADLDFLGEDFGLSNRLGCSSNLANKVKDIELKKKTPTKMEKLEDSAKYIHTFLSYKDD